MSELLPKQGDVISFYHGDGYLTGFVNGEPIHDSDENGSWVYVPVYVREGDRCMLVDATNIRPAAP